IDYDGRHPIPMPILHNIPANQPVLVEGVHIYANLINFPTLPGAGLGATDQHHRAMLAFLHLHYQACDLAVAHAEARRVDFHGQRLHSVVLEPFGDEAARVRKAVYLATLIQYYGFYLSNERFGGEYRPLFRIGIDTGPAVAIDSGRASEPEPLFLGNPANYAAKLAEPDWSNPQGGIYLSDRARQLLGLPRAYTLAVERLSPLTAATVETAVRAHLAGGAILGDGEQFAANIMRTIREQVDAFERELKTPLNNFIQPAQIKFGDLQTPLRQIVFANLSPSKSLRGPLASVFGDIDGFTNYIAVRIARSDMTTAVRNIHVIRGELAAVLKEDFNGRKVRFIGDCVHGVLAEKTGGVINLEATVTASVLCAAGMQSSFELCSQLLDDMAGLGLAVGVEAGATPITRLGLRGERSVRCSVGYSSIVSEQEQQSSARDQVGIGPNAHRLASGSVRALFDAQRKATGLRYPTAEPKVSATKSHLLQPASAAAAGFAFPPRPAAPNSPAGFA
ncbi:MAG: hypothetical protein AB7U97_22730, partial [Pirellulales bacterium]